MTLPVEIRPALLSDIPEIAQVHLASSKIAYRDIIDPLLLDGLSSAGRVALWEGRFARIGPAGRLWVQCVGSDVIGFALCDAADEEQASTSTCELKSLYLTPQRWDSGFGASLIAHVVKEFKDHGFNSMILLTIRQNSRARSFYERIGYSCDGLTRITRRKESGLQLEYEEIRYSKAL